MNVDRMAKSYSEGDGAGGGYVPSCTVKLYKVNGKPKRGPLLHFKWVYRLSAREYCCYCYTSTAGHSVTRTLL